MRSRVKNRNTKDEQVMTRTVPGALPVTSTPFAMGWISQGSSGCSTSEVRAASIKRSSIEDLACLLIMAASIQLRAQLAQHRLEAADRRHHQLAAGLDVLERRGGREIVPVQGGPEVP